MIQSADEFKYLRLSENIEEQYRASNDDANKEVWIEVINKFPKLREWVAHNKKIQIETGFTYQISKFNEAVEIIDELAPRREFIFEPINLILSFLSS